MKYRKLRIAWSAVWGVVAVLLIVLWVRSFKWVEAVTVQITQSRDVTFGTVCGTIGLGTGAGTSAEWLNFTNYTVEEMERLWKQLGFQLPSSYWGGTLKSSTHVAVFIPIWILSSVATALGVLPRLPLKRFSLRTLLVATTLIAIGLGLIVSMR